MNKEVSKKLEGEFDTILIYFYPSTQLRVGGWNGQNETGKDAKEYGN